VTNDADEVSLYISDKTILSIPDALHSGFLKIDFIHQNPPGMVPSFD